MTSPTTAGGGKGPWHCGGIYLRIELSPLSSSRCLARGDSTSVPVRPDHGPIGFVEAERAGEGRLHHCVSHQTQHEDEGWQRCILAASAARVPSASPT